MRPLSEPLYPAWAPPCPRHAKNRGTYRIFRIFRIFARSPRV